MGILKSNLKDYETSLKEPIICKIHGKKLEAFCESDNNILCLNCVLGEHKNHKVLSIDEVID